MKKITSLLLALLLCFPMLYACSGEKKPDKALTAEFRTYFEEMLTLFNEEKFEDYVSYFGRLEQEEQDYMLASLKALSQSFKTSYIIDDVEYRELENNQTAVLVTCIVEHGKAGESVGSIYEKQSIRFIMEKGKDGYEIVSYQTLESTDLTPEDEDLIQKWIEKSVREAEEADKTK